jgi:hypothetical protein
VGAALQMNINATTTTTSINPVTSSAVDENDHSLMCLSFLERLDEWLRGKV